MNWRFYPLLKKRTTLHFISNLLGLMKPLQPCSPSSTHNFFNLVSVLQATTSSTLSLFFKPWPHHHFWSSRPCDPSSTLQPSKHFLNPANFTNLLRFSSSSLLKISNLGPLYLHLIQKAFSKWSFDI
jgi:hypothetical protein